MQKSDALIKNHTEKNTVSSVSHVSIHASIKTEILLNPASIINILFLKRELRSKCLLGGNIEVSK